MRFVCEWTASAILLSGLHVWSMTGEYLHRGRIMSLIGMWPLLLLSSPVAVKEGGLGRILVEAMSLCSLRYCVVDIQRHLTFALLNYSMRCTLATSSLHC